MNKYLTILMLSTAVFLNSVVAQETMVSKESVVNFDGGKNIEAENSTSKFIIRDSDDSIVSLITIKDFIFPNSLMQEHFNENYLESDKYPEASFSGKLNGFDKNELSNEKQTYEAEGKMTIHGVTQKVKLPVTLCLNQDGGVQLDSSFMVKLEDYKIKIPQIVFVKISEEAKVTLKAIF